MKKKDEEKYGARFARHPKFFKMPYLITIQLKKMAADLQITENTFMEIALENEFKRIDQTYKTVKELKLEISKQIIDKVNK